MIKPLRLHVEVTQFVAKSGEIPALSRNGNAPLGTSPVAFPAPT